MAGKESRVSVSPHVKREVAGTALLLFSVFVLGALTVGALRHAVPGEGCSSAGAIFGPVGGCLNALLVNGLGAPGAWLLALVPMVHALRIFGRLQESTDRSWLVFLGGLVVLLPIGIALATGAHRELTSSSGLWGAFAAFYLSRGFGVAGAWILFALAASALTAATLAWNPLRLVIGPQRRAEAGDTAAAARRDDVPQRGGGADVGGRRARSASRGDAGDRSRSVARGSGAEEARAESTRAGDR